MRKTSKSGKPAKRADGFGTEPYERKDGRWQSEIMIGVTPSGRRIRKTVYGATSNECAAKLKQAIFAFDKQELVAGRSPTVIDWVDYWLDNVPATRVRPRTKAAYRSVINTWLRNTKVARVRLDKVTPEHIESLYKAMRDAGRSESTVCHLHRLLARAFKIAQQRQKIGIPPTSRLDAPQPAPAKPVVLTTKQVEAVVAVARVSADAARWMLALTLGPRQGEVLGLAWDDIDLETGRLHIRRELFKLTWEHGCNPGGEPTCRTGRDHSTKTRGDVCPQRTGGGYFTGPPKTDESDRTLVMPDPLIELFRQHRAAQSAGRTDDHKPFTSANKVTLDLVFDRPDGRCRDHRQDWAAWKKLLKTAGAPPVRLHDARHTAATSMLLIGIEPKVVMSLLGWTQTAMLDRYQHVLDEMKVDAATRIGDAMFGVPEGPPPPGVVSLAAFRKRRPGATPEPEPLSKDQK